jgi:hypothetical protein
MLLQRAKQQAQDEQEPQDNPQEESAEPQQAEGMQEPDESQENPQEESGETPGQESQEHDDGSDDLPEGEPASPEDEAELKRALGAFAAAVYKNDGTFNSIVQKLKNPDIPPRNCSSCGGKMNASTKAETCNLCQKKIQEEFLKNFSWK